MTPLIDDFVRALSRLPGLGPKSARKAALHLIKARLTALEELIGLAREVQAHVKTCALCGNLDAADPCAICADPRRDARSLCVVAEVSDLWALEKAGAFRGRYFVLGGVLSPFGGLSPSDLPLGRLAAQADGAAEVIIALPATVEGLATAHYVAQSVKAAHPSAAISKLAQGLPVGGELDYLDEGTIQTAFTGRTGF
ncbi:recombination protein RecR [Alphaproteobacteria bacterium]|nr:recombination protein RecR [Alphaproteobacteria bacterium]